MSNYERGLADGRADGCRAVKKMAERMAAVERDRDEWKRQHENLLAVRNQDIAALTAKASQIERETLEKVRLAVVDMNTQGTCMVNKFDVYAAIRALIPNEGEGTKP